jgi:hypothetical protein
MKCIECIARMQSIEWGEMHIRFGTVFGRRPEAGPTGDKRVSLVQWQGEP